MPVAWHGDFHLPDKVLSMPAHIDNSIRGVLNEHQKGLCTRSTPLCPPHQHGAADLLPRIQSTQWDPGRHLTFAFSIQFQLLDVRFINCF